MKINKIKFILMAAVCAIIACSYEYGEEFEGSSFTEPDGCDYHYTYKVTNEGDEVCWWHKKDIEDTPAPPGVARICLGSDWQKDGCVPRSTFEDGGPFKFGGYTFSFNKKKKKIDIEKSSIAVQDPAAVSLDNCNLLAPGAQEGCPLEVPNLGPMAEDLMKKHRAYETAQEEPVVEHAPVPVEPPSTNVVIPNGEMLPAEPPRLDPMGNHMELQHPGDKPGNEINAR